MILLDHMGQRQSQDIFIKGACFFGVAATPCKMVQPFDCEAHVIDSCSKGFGKICPFVSQFGDELRLTFQIMTSALENGASQSAATRLSPFFMVAREGRRIGTMFGEQDRAAGLGNTLRAVAPATRRPLAEERSQRRETP